MDDEKRARAIIDERSQEVCEICGQARATDWSHRKARSQGGLWCPTNGLDACRRCHSFAHDNPNWAKARGIFVEPHADPATVPARTRHGLVLLHEDGTMTAAPDRTPLPADVAATLAMLDF